MSPAFDPAIHHRQQRSEAARFQTILQRIDRALQHDEVVQKTADDIRDFLQVDRVVLYYFYRQWEGQVTFESLSDRQYSIAGSTGPDQCFNGEYAALYLDGRVSAIADIETAPIAPCHRDFLRHLQVRANLVVPILVMPALPKKDSEGASEQSPEKALWGLLVAHHCQGARSWPAADIERMEAGAAALANASSVKVGSNPPVDGSTHPQVHLID